MTEDEIAEIARQTAEALRSDPAWWEIVAAFGPVAVLAGAVATLWIGLASVRRQRISAGQQSKDNRDALDLQRANAEKQSDESQAALAERRRADDRAEWWKRAQWALDAVLSGDRNREALGFRMLDRLTESGSAGKEDLELLDPAWLRSAASSQSQADETLGETRNLLQDMANQGLINDDYLEAFQQTMDEENGKEHNGTDTDREVSDEPHT